MKTAKQYLDDLMARGGRKPAFFHINMSDCPDFVGKLEESAELYQDIVTWPMVLLGSYQGIVLILEVKRL